MDPLTLIVLGATFGILVVVISIASGVRKQRAEKRRAAGSPKPRESHIAPSIQSLYQKCVHLETLKPGKAPAPIGATRIGGQPDLPAGTPWPTREGAPMEFLAQINLAEFARFESMRDLPREGLLSFFQDSRDTPYETTREGRGGWEVVHIPAPLPKLERLKWPGELPKEQRSKGCAATLREAESPPGYDFPFGSFGVTHEEEVAYSNWEEDHEKEADGEGYGGSQILGHAVPVQSDVLGEIPEEVSGEADRHRDWRLLFQVASDANAGTNWVDTGTFYFLIEKKALAERRFDNVWCVLQFY